MRMLIFLLCIVFSTCAFADSKVLINQFVDHPALNMTTKGIIDGLEQNGFKRGVNLELRVESAQAGAALASQIAAKFMSQQPDVVVGVGTISAQSFMKYTKENKVKLVFSSITDPVGSGLVNNLTEPGNNVSGVSNFIALEPQMELFLSIQPQLKRLGILYNPGELNSVGIVKKMDALCSRLGIILVKQTANSTAEIPQATAKLAGQVDAIFISNDNTALSALRSVVRVANNYKIPVYVSDIDAVELGALAALGPNQYEVGLQTGKMIASILNGADINRMPVEFPKTVEPRVNKEAARILGIELPSDVATPGS